MHNQYFATLARAMVAAGQGSSIIRLGWEFNGIWFPWGASGHAGQFVAYWRQIVTTMRSVPGADFTFEWNPSRGDLGAGNLAVFYPGNKYVDYVGLDVFDVEWQSYPGAKAEFSHIEAGPYGLDWLAAFSKQHNKPMVFPEWGLGWGQSNNGAAVTGSGAVGGGDNSVFITDMTRWFATHRVFEATYLGLRIEQRRRNEKPIGATRVRDHRYHDVSIGAPVATSSSVAGRGWRQVRWPLRDLRKVNGGTEASQLCIHNARTRHRCDTREPEGGRRALSDR